MAFVYILENNKHFKIGLTKRTAQKRLKELQTGNPYELKLKLLISTNRPKILEQLLHSKFSSSRRLGEWFELTEKQQELLFSTNVQKGYCDFNGKEEIIRLSSGLINLLGRK